MHADFVFSVRQRPEREGIVKIFGIGRVDSECEHVSHVTTTQNLGLIDMLASVNFNIGIRVGQAVLSQNAVHLGIVLSVRTQHVQHSTFGHVTLGPAMEQFDHNLITLLGIPHVIGRYYDVVFQQFAVGIDDTASTNELETTDKRVRHDRVGVVGYRLALRSLLLFLLQHLCTNGLQTCTLAFVRLAFFFSA